MTMSRLARSTLAVAAGALLLGACSDSTSLEAGGTADQQTVAAPPLTLDTLGACSDPDAPESKAPQVSGVKAMLGDDPGDLYLAGGVAQFPADPPPPNDRMAVFSLVDPTTFEGEPAPERKGAGPEGELLVDMERDKATRATFAVDHGASLLVRLTSDSPSFETLPRPSARGTFAVFDDGSVVAVWDCGDVHFNKPLAHLMAKLDGSRTEIEVVRELLTNPRGDIATTLEQQNQPTPWIDQPADERIVADAPPEIQAQQASYRLTFTDIPDAWFGDEHILCTKSAQGWGPGCLGLSDSRRGEAPYHLRAQAAPGDPLEVVLQRGTSVTDPYTVIGTITPDLLTSPGITVTIAGTDPTNATLTAQPTE